MCQRRPISYTAPTFNSDAGQTLDSMRRVEQLLTETGATLWIEHDKALADTLKKSTPLLRPVELAIHTCKPCGGACRPAGELFY